MGKSVFGQFYDKKILDLMRPYAGRVLVAILFSLFSSGASGGIVWLVKPVIDSIFVDQNYGLLAWLPVAIIFLYFLRGSCQMIYSYLMRSAGIKLVRDIRIRLYNHLIHLPVSALGTESSAKIISRILNDVAGLSLLVSNILLTIFKEIPTIIVLLGVALYRSWSVTMLAFIVLPIIIYCAHRIGRYVKAKRTQALKTIAIITNRISEAVTGAKVIKIFGNEAAITKKFISESKNYYRQETKIIRFRELAKLVVDISTGIGVGLVVWYGGSLVVKEVITSGDLFSALGAVVMVFGPVKKLGSSYSTFQETRAAVERLRWLEQLEEEKSGDNVLQGFNKEISFVNVSHRYIQDGDLVLKNINLTIKKGDVVAIVGASGAGKTTLIDLIPRFYDPIEGKVLLDGKDIRSVSLSELRKLIGLVSQDVMLFNDTIRKNIALASPDASDIEIKRAARFAYAHEFISELPDGYDTLLGERGLNLSGGQRQRIAIARAILKNPPILILDEATSALDAVSEGLVQKALEKLMQERTTIVVAHRLSTIQKADNILVMEHGQILSQGNHDELLQYSNDYQKLYKSYNQS
ncbi:MAG: ABC transporter ATP-binding protein [Desulfobulbaceae bacterium]|nr:ABC transporter ATP-binding protein [Desulfobulbaceae bacterium]